MVSNSQRRAETRSKLIQAAHQQFVVNGFEGTNTTAILEQAGISRGGLYHHFDGKKELFEAVFVQVTVSTIEMAIKKGKRSDSPIDDLISACFAWLRSVRRTEVAAILLDQGPQVLGWKRAREIEAKYSLAPMMQSLQAAVDFGVAEIYSVRYTAQLINAVLAEAALEVLYGSNRISVRVQETSIRQLIEGLIAPSKTNHSTKE